MKKNLNIVTIKVVWFSGLWVKDAGVECILILLQLFRELSLIYKFNLKKAVLKSILELFNLID